MERYRFTYKNGMSQVKNLISHETYLNEIKSRYKEIMELESINIELGKKNKTRIENEKKIAELEKEIKTYGDFFTDQSPLFLALQCPSKIELNLYWYKYEVPDLDHPLYCKQKTLRTLMQIEKLW